MFGGLTFIKATGEETDGAYGVIEQRANAGMRTPLHVHHAEDELWFVIDGQLSVHVGERRSRSEPVIWPLDHEVSPTHSVWTKTKVDTS
ncbi:cupin domain-containing protein [Halalkalicoccus salilacus]|uniref:hypothetical protein n=1 Tax=Halalkalicoccus sp. GCM10025704 TaxID=3252662 RepID=UPI00360AEB1D